MPPSWSGAASSSNERVAAGDNFRALREAAVHHRLRARRDISHLNEWIHRALVPTARGSQNDQDFAQWVFPAFPRRRRSARWTRARPTGPTSRPMQRPVRMGVPPRPAISRRRLRRYRRARARGSISWLELASLPKSARAPQKPPLPAFLSRGPILPPRKRRYGGERAV